MVHLADGDETLDTTNIDERAEGSSAGDAALQALPHGEGFE